MRVGESLAQIHVRALPPNLRTTTLNRLHGAFYHVSCGGKAGAPGVYHRTSQHMFERLRVALYVAVVDRTARVLRPK